jgi:hypothetical protein
MPDGDARHPDTRSLNRMHNIAKKSLPQSSTTSSAAPPPGLATAGPLL